MQLRLVQDDPAAGPTPAAMERPATRRKLDIAVGAIFILIALGILFELFRRSGP